MKPGCCLCEEVIEWLRELASEFPIQLKLVDIRQDWETYQRLHNKIPVVRLNNQVELMAPIKKEDLRQLLKQFTQKGQET